MEGRSSKQNGLLQFDHKQFLQTFCSPAVDPSLFEELFLFPIRLSIQNIHLVKSLGGTLCSLSKGPYILYLLPFCDYFSDIIVLKTNESCVKEVERWLKKEENALDDVPEAKFISDMGFSSLNLLEKEDNLRRKVKRVMIYDPSDENPAVPQKVDCLIVSYTLQYISGDQESFRRNLMALTANMKTGGVLMACGTFNTHFFIVGEQKVSSFSYDESFLRKVLEEAGFTIKCLEKQRSKMLSEVAKYEEVWFVAAVKM
ncbi:nicotinamide N-methyltransferase-like [Dendropsophus ebraccatus]|uniref:nicotinamide N-methyltransferase-like n=1 Tax=Dendropsophus ebraccatus TaxID=150705 RepID=UPI0038317DAA